ncbi:MAG: hypothetical protein NT169_28300 [Chloroflexi bacterium]|nr:hypothetical protein [Chloroflexota bacterium]
MSARNRFIIIGALAGAVLGATTAWAYTKAQEGKLPASGQTGRLLRLQAGAPEYVKLGMALLAFVRQTVDLFKPV